MFRQLYRLGVFLVLCQCIAACGWHLRGAYELPPEMKTTYIDSSIQTSELVRQLNRDLRAANVNSINYPAEDAAVLKVSVRTGSRTLSIGSDGKALEYELFASARFSLSIPGSTFAVADQQIMLTRDQVFDPLDVLAANKEQALLHDDMERQLAGMILDRISAAYANRKL